MDYQKISQDILKHVGGEENIELVDYCATRLRFRLRNIKKADRDSLEKIKGVMGTTFSGGQLQVIIGSDVANVYRAVMDIADIDKSERDSDGETEKSKLSIVLDTIAGVFTPILPAITGAGMINCINFNNNHISHSFLCWW